MSQSIQQLKAALRETVRAQARAVSPGERASASAQICLRLQQQAVWRGAATILFFAPLPEEPDVRPLLAQALAEGKRAALPRYAPTQDIYEVCQINDPQRDLRAGRFGLFEPLSACPSLDLKQLDLTLVPGVAFALNGNRLGRGKGYYDRLLEKIPGCKCGVAFDWQLRLTFPRKRTMFVSIAYLTPTRWQEVRPARGFEMSLLENPICWDRRIRRRRVVGYWLLRWKERNMRAAVALQEKSILESRPPPSRTIAREARLQANEERAETPPRHRERPSPTAATRCRSGKAPGRTGDPDQSPVAEHGRRGEVPARSTAGMPAENAGTRPPTSGTGWLMKQRRRTLRPWPN